MDRPSSTRAGGMWATGEMRSSVASMRGMVADVPADPRPGPKVVRCQQSEPMGPGLSIAHYRVTSKLGEGGMGEVWRAIDTKLNRNVAIKVLPDSFAADPDRMARFQREAQVLASLNH